MKYMLLITADWTRGPARGTPEGDAQSQRWITYTEELERAGAYVSGEALQPPDTATTVAVRDGERVVTDGPFADTKEWLGGFYVVDVPDLDTALDLAAQMPHVAFGSVEVRPVMEVPATARS